MAASARKKGFASPQFSRFLGSPVYSERRNPPRRILDLLEPTSDMATTDTAEIKDLQLHATDTGSADVQVALLTRRINELTEHLKAHVKDHASRRGLLKMVARRRSLLDYLDKTANDRYKKVIGALGLRK